MAQKQIDQQFIPYDSLAEQGYINPADHPSVDPTTLPGAVVEQAVEPVIEKASLDYKDLLNQGYIAPENHPSVDVATIPRNIKKLESGKKPSREAIADAARLAVAYTVDGTSGNVLIPSEAAGHMKAHEQQIR